jgi:hypothetical protein
VREALSRIEDGLRVGSLSVFIGEDSKGRFREERNYRIHVKRGRSESYLLTVKAFFGREPHYLPWIEFYAINPNIDLDGGTLVYFGSTVEETLLSTFSHALPPGGKIFIEYVHDDKTRCELERGTPPPLTRMGFLLLKLGFTWLRDWYIPEGFWEGEPKLQGEKPLTESYRRRHIVEIVKEVTAFSKLHPCKSERLQFILEFAERILK